MDAATMPRPACAPDAVLQQLECILRSADFDASERNRRFLRYVVQEVLAGRGERIKAYSIATAVFGRDASFDPQTDAIVRIEARRLRRSLERYYLTGGKHDRVWISIPKGAYGARFEAGWPPRAGDSGAERASASPHGPGILVLPFDEDGAPAALTGFTRGFTRHLVVSLTRFTDLLVFGPEAPPCADNDADRHLADSQACSCFDYALRGGTTLSDDHFTVEALLVDARRGRNVWAANFERSLDPAEVFTTRDEVATRIARILAQPYGVIFSDAAQKLEGRRPESLNAQECVMLFHQYWRSPSRESHECVRACLERTVAHDPGYAQTMACLSLVYSDKYQFGPDRQGNGIDPLERALNLAHRAVELAPYSCRPHQALSLALWLSHDHSGSLDELETGRSLNPDDTLILAELGLRHALLAQWPQAVPLLEQCYARNPLQPGRYRLGLALFHYVHGHYDRALVEARKIGMPHTVWGHVLEAIAAAQLRRQDEARAAVQRILAIDPAYADRAAADLLKHDLSLDLIQAILDGLRKVGLSGRDWSAMAGCHLRVAMFRPQSMM